MSDCRCSGTPGQNDTWDYHSAYCPVYMQGKIAELEIQLKQVAGIIDHALEQPKDGGVCVLHLGEWLRNYKEKRDGN